MRNKLLVVVAGLSLSIPTLIGFMLGKQTVAFPLPALIFISVFSLHKAAVAVPPVFFFIWNPGLFQSDHRIPGRSYALLIAATVLSVVWFAVGWRHGLAIQGAKYTYLICSINILWVIFLWAAFARNLKGESSFRTNLVLHWILFAWLAWYAFPFLGELI